MTVMARRARSDDLPELELLPVIGDADGVSVEGAPAEGRRPARWRTLGVLAMGLTGVLLFAGVTGRSEPPVEVLPSPPTTAPTNPSPPTSGPGQRPAPSAAVVPTSDGRGVFISTSRWSGTIEVAPELGRVTSVASARGFVVVTLSSGQVRRYSRSEADGTPLGAAELVLSNVRDPSVAWAVQNIGSVQVVRGIAAASHPEPMALQVPDGWRVVGATWRGLVLTGHDSGSGIAVWEVWDDAPPVVIDAAGRFLASNRRSVAWFRDGRVIQSAGPFGEQSLVPMPDTVVAAAFSPDARHLAVVARSREGPGWNVRLVIGGHDVDDGFVVPSVAPPALGWTADGMLLVDRGGPVEYRYDPLGRSLTTSSPDLDR